MKKIIDYLDVEFTFTVNSKIECCHCDWKGLVSETNLCGSFGRYSCYDFYCPKCNRIIIKNVIEKHIKNHSDFKLANIL